MPSKNKALWVRLVAKQGQEHAVENFLKGGLDLVNEEPLTLSWYALNMGGGVFGIFDAFEGEEGRDAHLSGKVAEALLAHADELLSEPPTIQKVDLIAAK